MKSDDLRMRARNCRALAVGARNYADRTMLEDMAADLEVEAGIAAAEEAAAARALDPDSDL